MDSTNHRHVTRVATGAGTGAAAGVVVLVLSPCAVSHPPALERVRLTPPADHVLAGRLAAADVVVAGVLTRAQRDIRYEAPCGIIAHIMRRCDDTEAYDARSEEHTSELQSQSNLVCRLLLEKKKYTHDDHKYVSTSRRH